jgi:hypothetical protein
MKELQEAGIDEFNLHKTSVRQRKVPVSRREDFFMEDRSPNVIASDLNNLREDAGEGSSLGGINNISDTGDSTVSCNLVMAICHIIILT